MGNGFSDNGIIRAAVAPGFDGYALIDFSQSSAATVTTTTEGVSLVPAGPILVDGFESPPE